jgi:hypothetical protein
MVSCGTATIWRILLQIKALQERRHMAAPDPAKGPTMQVYVITKYQAGRRTSYGTARKSDVLLHGGN